MVIADDFETLNAQELFTRARAGEARAFCLLMEPLQTRLLRQAFALSGDLSTAEDIVSETLVEVWKSLSRYNETCRFSTWLYSILLHRHQKTLKRARSRPISLARLSMFEANELHERQQNIPCIAPTPDEVATQSELVIRLQKYLEALPEKHRQIILLRFFEDASLPDMAMVLGCSIGTVKSRLHHALEKLRKMKMNLSELRGDKQI